MPNNARRRAPGSARRDARRRRPSWPEVLLAVATVAVSAAGWWVLVHDAPGDHTGLELGLGWGAYTGAALVASTWRTLVRPGGVGRWFGDMSRLQRTDPIPRRGAAIGWPPRRLWALPLLQVPLFALALPLAYHASPGDNSIIAVLFLDALGVSWAGVVTGLAVWVFAVLPVAALGRAAWFLVRRRPFDDAQRTATVLGLLLLEIELFATGIVLRHDDRHSDTAAFFGAGDQSSPWLWVARGAAVAGVVTVVETARRMQRPARRRAPDAAATRPGQTVG